MAKVPKSIRVEQEVFDYIEDYEGNGFNQKFENIILFAMKTEKDMKERIKILDREIKARNVNLKSINDDIYKRKDILYKLENIFRLVESVENSVK